MPAPKEQPPRVSQVDEPRNYIDFLQKRRCASADGITFSGKHTEGAPSNRHDPMRCPDAVLEQSLFIPTHAQERAAWD